MPRIVITLGDPAGIGPEITVKALSATPPGYSFIIAGSRAVFDAAVKNFAGAAFKRRFSRIPDSPIDSLKKSGRPLAFVSTGDYPINRLRPGVSGKPEGTAAWQALAAAMKLLKSGAADALVTAPVNKAALKAAGFPAPGHTDWLAEQAGGRAVMMLLSGRLRVVPVTMHIPLDRVSAALTAELLIDTIMTVDADLRRRFGIKKPRIAVSGLNPHAGEGGMLGTEECDTIIPAVKQCGQYGIICSGPFPADTLFTPQKRKTFDAAVCMYHDQALLPVKMAGFASAVNVTLGLSIIRTSPAHGTAPEIAWTGQADPRSMTAALGLAAHLAETEAKAKS